VYRRKNEDKSQCLGDGQKQRTKGKQESFYPPQSTSSLSDVRPAYADSLLTFPPLPIFAESPPPHNLGEIQVTEGQGWHYAVSIMIDRGMLCLVDITGIVLGVVMIVCLGVVAPFT